MDNIRSAHNQLAVTFTQAAEMLGGKKSWFYAAVRRGDIDLPVIRIGAKSLIPVAAIERWLEQRTEQAG